MAQVPAHYIKFKQIDYDAEIFAALSVPFVLAGLELAPPSIGVMSLLEVVDNPIFNEPQDATAFDFYRALFIASDGRKAAPLVRDWTLQGGKEKFNPEKKDTWLSWDREIEKFSDDHPVKEASDIFRFREFLIANTFNGYEMIPDTCPSGHMPYVFGAETIAATLRMCAGLGMSKDQIIWDMPLCVVGHMAACEARKNGVKGVSRPKDEGDIKKQLADANERESKGELHPWQIKEPDMYGLQESQIKARPEVKTEYNAILKACLKAKRAKETAANG